MSTLILEGPSMSVRVDPGRGSDILSIVHTSSGTELMFSTPWRERADDIRDGRASVAATGSMESWLEQYRGGWQTLCPNAGAPRTMQRAPFGYHGEASVASWRIVDQRDDTVRLSTTLFSIPVSIEREIAVGGNSVSVTDVVTNLSADDLHFDYAHHPAFGGAFLEGPCTIDTGARTYVNDSEGGISGVEPNSRHDWPMVTGESGAHVNLSVIPEPLEARGVFGWLTDFTDHWASVTNHRLGLTARLEWDGTALPYAWFWQELNASSGWPWYRRARVIAIEPASTQTSGPDRVSSMKLGPHDHVRIPITMTTSEGDSIHD